MLDWLTIGAIQDWYWIIPALPLFLVGVALILLGTLTIVAAPFRDGIAECARGAHVAGRHGVIRGDADGAGDAGDDAMVIHTSCPTIKNGRSCGRHNPAVAR
jgi:hypothetical protein